MEWFLGYLVKVFIIFVKVTIIHWFLDNSDFLHNPIIRFLPFRFLSCSLNQDVVAIHLFISNLKI